MSGRSELIHEVIGELRALKRQAYQPTSDVDLVWVISQPGTVNKLSEDGVYKILAELKISNDLEVVRYGRRLVTEITALRLGGRYPSSVSRLDIEKHGPIFFYNGEDSTTPGFKYPQNEDLEVMAAQPDFLIPRTKMVIDHIHEIGTPAQITGFARFLQTHPEVKRVAVVSMAPHSVRVGRYLEHYKGLFPAGVAFENACLAETHIAVGSILREIRKVVKYLELGHLARNNYFFPPIITSS